MQDHQHRIARLGRRAAAAVVSGSARLTRLQAGQRWRCRRGSRAARASGCATRCTATGTATRCTPPWSRSRSAPGRRRRRSTCWTPSTAKRRPLPRRSGPQHRGGVRVQWRRPPPGWPTGTIPTARTAESAGPRRAQHDVAGALLFVPGAAPPRPPARRQSSSAPAWSLLLGGAYLGAHLAPPPPHRRRPGGPELGAARLHAEVGVARAREDRPRRVEVRTSTPAPWSAWPWSSTAAVHALGAALLHMGRPSARDGCWGGPGLPGTARYDLATGHPIDGPSTCPQPRYAETACDGVVEIRKPPGAWRTPSWCPRTSPPTATRWHRRSRSTITSSCAGCSSGSSGRRATAPSAAAPCRARARQRARDARDDRDEIFYPAVRPVSEEVHSHSEHRQLADLLAVVLGLDTASPASTSTCAPSTTRSSTTPAPRRLDTRESRRLGDARLRELGHRLEARLEELRSSRFQRARRG